MFIVSGESLIDMVAAADGTFSPVPGGAPYNFARALALQGVPTGYANPFSDDLFGSLLKKTLEESGARHLGAISGKPTSLALVATDERGQPQYSFYRSQVADRDIDRFAVFLDLDGNVAFELVKKLFALVPVIVLARIRPADDHYDKIVVRINALVPDRRLEQMPMLVDPFFEIERPADHSSASFSTVLQLRPV